MGRRPLPCANHPSSTQFSPSLCYSQKEPPVRTPTVLSSVPTVSPCTRPAEDFGPYPHTVTALPLFSRCQPFLGSEDTAVEN